MMNPVSRRAALGMIGAGLIAAPMRRSIAAASTTSPTLVDIETTSGRISRVTHWRASIMRGTITRGTILFSHGAMSSPAKYDPLILPFVAAGFDVWAPLHVDSTDHPDTSLFPGLASWGARIEDMRALSAHVGGSGHIAAGHSYGGLTALTLGGAQAVIPEGVTGPLRDPRTRAVLAFSPPGLAPGLIDGAGYAGLAVPAFIQTGDKDFPPGPLEGAVDPAAWKQHLLAYDSAKTGGDRYALILDGVDHYFGGLICSPERPGPRQSTQMQQAVTLSLQFLRGYGTGSARARAALDGALIDTGPVALWRR